MAKTEKWAFEPAKKPLRNAQTDLSEVGLCAMLAWRDSFRTFEWEKAFPDPVIVVEQTKRLLALAGGS